MLCVEAQHGGLPCEEIIAPAMSVAFSCNVGELARASRRCFHRGDEGWHSAVALPLSIRNAPFHDLLREAVSGTPSEKEVSPAVLGGENSGNAVEPSHALKKKGFGDPQPYSRGEFQEKL